MDEVRTIKGQMSEISKAIAATSDTKVVQDLQKQLEQRGQQLTVATQKIKELESKPKATTTIDQLAPKPKFEEEVILEIENLLRT
jgi:hypothetical protein